MFQYIETPIAAFFAITFLGETITPPFIFGIILIFAGVYLGTLSKEIHHKISKIHRV
jgi:drug/metabolite transporter (DMT)-like permease